MLDPLTYSLFNFYALSSRCPSGAFIGMVDLGFSVSTFSFLHLPPHKKGIHLKAVLGIRGGG